MGGYLTVWEFRVHPDRRAQFEERYGPDGAWAALFRRAEGYLGTELLHDRNDALRYLTIDRWTTVEAYRSFRARFVGQYASLDQECEGLTAHEAALGEYDEGIQWIRRDTPSPTKTSPAASTSWRSSGRT